MKKTFVAPALRPESSLTEMTLQVITGRPT